MPYISAETVKTKRQQINSFFPSRDGWKISTRKEDSNSLVVTILAGPIQLVDGQRDIRWDTQGVSQDATKVLRAIYEVASEGRTVQHHDQDYGSVPNFYLTVRVGAWDRPYQLTN
jgi:hypothetical protein